MFLLLHIIIAITSIAYSSFVFFSPSKSKLKISYLLVMMTLGSGTYLLLLKPAHMVQTCFTGLIYISFVTLAIASARNKLAKNQTTN